jgi:pheromone a factor receptor
MILTLYPIGLSLQAFWMRRVQLNDMLSKTSSMTIGRYVRMILLSLCEMICTIPLGAYCMYFNTHRVPLVPYVSWANIHYDFNRAELVPAVEWKSDRSFQISVELNRWIYPVCAFLFFALFGFSEEARKNYRLVFCYIAKRLGSDHPDPTAVGSYSNTCVLLFS